MKEWKPIKSEACKSILNVYARLREKNPEDSIKRSTDQVADLTGVSPRIIFYLKG